MAGDRAPEPGLLDAVRQGDENAFRLLVEPYRAAIHAHCYRMLGSLFDADDALQETLLRAWRALPRFQGHQLLRPWLYRIATNVCLNALARRRKRGLPVQHGRPAGPNDQPGEPRAGPTPARDFRELDRPGPWLPDRIGRAPGASISTMTCSLGSSQRGGVRAMSTAGGCRQRSRRGGRGDRGD